MLVSVALVMSGIFGFVVYKVAQARRMKVKVGPEMLVPTNTPTAGVSMGFPPLGVVSIQDLANQKKDEEKKRQ